MAQSKNRALSFGDHVVYSVVTMNRPEGYVGVRAHNNQIGPELLSRAKNLLHNFPGFHHYGSGRP
jgi:hypothetical protein